MRKRAPTPHTCAEPKCPELTAPGATHCPTHTRPPWRNRNTRRPDTLNGWQRQARAKRIIARDHGICHVCGHAGANEADHVIPLAHGGADNDSNLAAIHSQPCHRDKTTREAQQGRRVGRTP